MHEDRSCAMHKSSTCFVENLFELFLDIENIFFLRRKSNNQGWHSTLDGPLKTTSKTFMRGHKTVLIDSMKFYCVKSSCSDAVCLSKQCCSKRSHTALIFLLPESGLARHLPPLIVSPLNSTKLTQKTFTRQILTTMQT